MGEKIRKGRNKSVEKKEKKRRCREETRNKAKTGTETKENLHPHTQFTACIIIPSLSSKSAILVDWKIFSAMSDFKKFFNCTEESSQN
jgi:hypothetical protein